MRMIALPLLILTLSGCSVARDAVGFVSSIGSKSGTVTNAEANAASSDASIAARGITRADNMDDVKKRVPGGLVGDTKNSLHSGDPVTPQ
jgi:uncharacterized protein YceK